MGTEIVKIKGMTCMGCVNSVKNVLERIPGVGSAEVSLEQARATIQYDTTTTNVNQFTGAITEAGFEVVD